jgi:predicted DNA-binding transcriptional regulator YafY
MYAIGQNVIVRYNGTMRHVRIDSIRTVRGKTLITTYDLQRKQYRSFYLDKIGS